MDKVVHFEIPVDNEKRAQAFYKKLFGWEITEVPDMPYWMVRTVQVDENQMPTEAGAINGGFYRRSDGGAKNPVIVVNVASLDKSLKKVTEAGGAVTLKKRQVGDMGFYAQVKDTEGNVIGLWEMLGK